MSGTPPRVFISYSHDSETHKQRVLELSERLRADGVDATIDQYIANDGPPQGWPRWMDEQLRDANFVLMLCTSVYRRRVEGREETGRGRGVAWEGNLVYQHIYNAAARNDRFLPVLLDGASLDDVPLPLQGVPSYRPTDEQGYEVLYRRLTGQPLVQKGTLGSLRALPSRRVSVEMLPADGPPGASDVDGSGQQISAPGTHPPRSPELLSRSSTALAGLAAALLLLIGAAIFVWSRQLPDIYQVRVRVLDVQGRSVDDARVTSSVGGEVMRSGTDWQFTIPATARPADGKVIVRAERPAAFQQGETELQLGRSAAVPATIELRGDPQVRVRGIVLDTSRSAIAAARVVVIGYEEHALTGEDGAFSLPAHAADGQQVQVRAQKAGYEASELWHPAGNTPLIVVLQPNR
jgi:hypothetical protein